ncbi:hypothetical protein N1851_009164 [Merluccius polli]|uniref:Uncharacterized protein n=1 Tax=Merluccius polli TaxID=89951 RepID=A0AA47N1M7_MERPO|nr:hypothetical protein N1851_009164 [Merluccius polli]
MEMKKLWDELKRVQQYEVDVSSSQSHLSKDGKQVPSWRVKKNLPDNHKRFTKASPQGDFTLRSRFKNKTQWRLGVAQESPSAGKVTSSDPRGRLLDYLPSTRISWYSVITLLSVSL